MNLGFSAIKTRNMLKTAKFSAAIAVLISLFLLPSCKVDQYLPEPERTLVEKALAFRGEDGSYRIAFYQPGEWDIYVGAKDPTNIDWNNPIGLNQEDSFFFEPQKPKQRYYFGAIHKEDTLILSERLIPLKGAENFRDVGGLMTKDGRMVEWGKIYRSNKLSGLKKDDLAYLGNIGIETVCDLRYDVEINKKPDRVPENATYYQFPIGDREGDQYMKLRSQLLQKEIVGEETKAKFVELMSIFADTAAHYFKPVVDLLLEGENTPLVYHCAGGKDRTGFLTAVILLALDVDKNTIREDYLMSNYYRYDHNRSTMKKARIIGLDYETLVYGLVVQNEYLSAVFEVIEHEYGGVDNYLEEQFGLDAIQRARLKEKYTIPVTAYLPDSGLEKTTAGGSGSKEAGSSSGPAPEEGN